MAVVYLHKRLDTDQVFYVGIGKSSKRAYCKSIRNPLWNNIARKVGYAVQILHKDLTREEALHIEKKLIKEYGRIDLGTGILTNMTDGGDGGSGVVVKSETKEKIRNFQLSLNKKGKPGRIKSAEEIEKIKATLTGRFHTEQSKALMRKPKINKENYSYVKDKVTCPHCNKESQPATAYRYHFDNCLTLSGKKKHVGKPTGPAKRVECPHCKKEGPVNAMARWHFNNCKFYNNGAV